MTDKEINQLIIAITLNLLSVGYLMHKVWSGNDKAIILMIFFYPLIIIVNAIIWLAAKSRVFKWTTIALLILFLPVLLMSSFY
jgi:hypothetical protein